MHRSPSFRILAALCACWLTLSVTVLAALHACPAHGEHGAGHHAGGAPAHAMASHHVAMDAGSSHHDRQSAPCTCVGDCSLVLALVVPPGARVTTIADVAPGRRVPDHRVRVWRPLLVEHARPPSVGPPHLTA
jgi:hypothetical protein